MKEAAIRGGLQHSKKAKPVINSASQISDSRKYKVLRSTAFIKRSAVN